MCFTYKSISADQSFLKSICHELRTKLNQYTMLHNTTQHNTIQHNTTQHNKSQHYTALHCTALHCTALHCTALHCTALHCTALHCTVLHCTTLLPCLGLVLPDLLYMLTKFSRKPSVS